MLRMCLVGNRQPAISPCGHASLVGLLVISFGHVNCPVHDVQNIFAEQVPLTQNPDRSAVTVQYITVMCELFQFHFCQLHQAVDFVLRAVEVLDAERVDCDNFDTAFVADFEHLEETRQEDSHRVAFAGQRTLARASKPWWWPSIVSIFFPRAYRRLPSISKATCWGIGPCFKAPIKRSLSCAIAHSAGGELINHLLMLLFRISDILSAPCWGKDVEEW